MESAGGCTMDNYEGGLDCAERKARVRDFPASLPAALYLGVAVAALALSIGFLTGKEKLGRCFQRRA